LLPSYRYPLSQQSTTYRSTAPIKPYLPNLHLIKYPF
jgi:hypothetical protein